MVATTDLLLYRATLSSSCRADEDIDPTFLPPHFSTTKPSTRHLGHDNNMRIVHNRFRHGNRAAVHPGAHLVGTLGWRALWTMFESQCGWLVVRGH